MIAVMIMTTNSATQLSVVGDDEIEVVLEVVGGCVVVLEA